MKTNDFRQAFAELAETQRLVRTPVPAEIAIHLDYLFDPELFSKGNGNYGVASATLTIAAAKTLCPHLNATLFSDAKKPDGHPSLRSLEKPVAEWIRRNVDPALIGADPGAGIRRNLMHDSPFDRNYGGSFADLVLRGAFLDLIEWIEMGDALIVFRGTLHRYIAMASRLPITPIESINEQTATWWIEQYLRENRSHRAQAVVWAVASEADPQVSWNKTLNSNDHDQVGDVNGHNYAVEITTIPATLNKVQDLCLKARRSGRCERVTLVIAQDRVCTSQSERIYIQDKIAGQFSDLEVNLTTLDDYLHAMVSGYGKVTWTSVCQRIGREVQNLNPRDSNAWNMLVAQRQPVVMPSRRPCNLEPSWEQPIYIG